MTFSKRIREKHRAELFLRNYQSLSQAIPHLLWNSKTRHVTMKCSWAISRFNVELVSDVSETVSVSVMRVDAMSGVFARYSDEASGPNSSVTRMI
jgi:hypothetical protein